VSFPSGLWITLEIDSVRTWHVLRSVHTSLSLTLTFSMTRCLPDTSPRAIEFPDITKFIRHVVTLYQTVKSLMRFFAALTQSTSVADRQRQMSIAYATHALSKNHITFTNNNDDDSVDCSSTHSSTINLISYTDTTAINTLSFCTSMGLTYTNYISSNSRPC